MNEYGKRVAKKMENFMDEPDSVDREINDIQNAIEGYEVRGALAAGVKKSFDKSKTAEGKSVEAYDITQNLLDESFDTSVINQNFEQRLDNEIANLQPEWTQFKDETTSQLAQTEKTVNILNFGAIGDGQTDDTMSIQNAIDSMTRGDSLLIPKGDYFVDGLVYNKNFTTIISRGRLIGGSGTAITINANGVFVDGTLHVERHTATWNDGSVGLKIKSSNRCNLTISVMRFDRGIVLEDIDGVGTAYNSVFLSNILDNRISMDFIVPGLNPNEGWVNENKFYGGRFGWSTYLMELQEGETLQEGFDRTNGVHINIQNRHMNNNVFFSPSLEGRAGKLIACGGGYNTFYSPRFEGRSIFIHWEVGSLYNQVVFPYHHNEVNEENYIQEGSRNQFHGRNFNDWEEIATKGGSFKAYGDPTRSTHFDDGDGMFDARPLNGNSQKNFRGSNTGGNETFYVTANGDALFRHLEIRGNINAKLESWKNITPLPEWKVHSPTWQPKYYRNHFWEVSLSGEIEGTGNHGDIIFNMPSGYRPSQNTYVSTTSRKGSVGSVEPAMLLISPNGNVSLSYTNLENRIINLGNISYRVG